MANKYNAVSPTEAQLHKSVADLLRVSLPAGVPWHHSPNEGRRGWHSQKALKDNGVRRGWPDIEIFWQGKGIFIELKSAKGRVGPEQKQVMLELTTHGMLCVICRSLGEVADLLNTVMGLDIQVSA